MEIAPSTTGRSAIISRVNHLYYGDNLAVLRESIAAESVDLIYLRGGGGDKRENPPRHHDRAAAA